MGIAAVSPASARQQGHRGPSRKTPGAKIRQVLCATKERTGGGETTRRATHLFISAYSRVQWTL